MKIDVKRLWKTKKKQLLGITAGVTAAAIGCGLWYQAGHSSKDPVYVYPFQYIGMTEYWGDVQESYGPVTTDKIQTVFLSETQTVTEILVQAGDTVKKGDLLMTFDTTLSDLQLERKRLEVEKLKLQLEDARDELNKLNGMKPMETPEISDEEMDESDEEDTTQKLTEPKGFPALTSDDSETYDGSTAERALILWIPADMAIDSSENLAMMESLAAQLQEKNGTEGAIEEYIPEDEPEVTVPEDDTDSEDDENTEDDDLEEDEGTGDENDTEDDEGTGDDNSTGDENDTEGDEGIGDDNGTGGENDTEDDEGTGDDNGAGGENDTGDDDGTEDNGDINNTNDTNDTEGNNGSEGGEDTAEQQSSDEEPDPIEENTAMQEADTELIPSSASADPDTSTSELEKGEVFYVVFKITEEDRVDGVSKYFQCMKVQKTGNQKYKLYVADTLITDYSAEEIKADDAFGDIFGDLFDEEDDVTEPLSSYTASQLAQMRSDQQKKIKELELQIKMTDAEYKIMQKEISDGNIYSDSDGKVVSLLTEEEARQTKQPVLKVSGGGGFYVEGFVSELEKENMKIGQEVTVNDWNTGMTYTGTVDSMGDFPTRDGYYNGSGNPNASYYPFQVFVDETADLQAGSYVSVQYSSAESQAGIYLENPFLRTEKGKSYVLVLGSNGRLEQRWVTTGKSLWGNYTEIKDNLTAEDLIAFPYGKNVKPGVAAQEGDLSNLYG